jgi:hypothetical protein
MTTPQARAGGRGVTEPIATARNARELCDAFRARVDQLNISMETLDSIAGLPLRYSAKLLAPVPVKQFGPMSLDAMLGALGLRLAVFEDAEQMARVKDRMVERKRRDKPMHSNTVHIQISGRKLKRAQRKGGVNSRKNLTPKERRKLARRAATARWARRDLRLQRAAERAAAALAKQNMAELLVEFDPLRSTP